MNELNRVEVVDREGWRKEFPLPKTLLYVGSGPGNDVVLDPLRGGGVEMRHLQLIPAGEDSQGYRVINLGDGEVTIRGQRIGPRSLADLRDGDVVQLGDFRLTFRMEQPAMVAALNGRAAGPDAPYLVPGLQTGPAAAQGATFGAAFGAGLGSLPEAGDSVSPSIGLKLSFAVPVLGADRPCDGIITVRNQGDRAGVQFRLALEGLEPSCYTIGPSPILFPNAEKDVFVRLVHPRGPVPPAGPHVIRVHATAPEAYPSEVTTVSQVVQIMPHYSHKLRIITG